MDQLQQILLNLGLPGVIIVALGWWALKREADLKELHSLRIAEWKEQTGQLQASTTALASWIPANEARTRAVDASIEAIKLLAAEVANLRSLLSDVREDATRALESNTQMRENLIKFLERMDNRDRR